jgi:hypothetical protein
MSIVSMKALAWAGGTVLLAWSGAENVQPAPAEFAAPVRLKAGDTFLGEKRLYPSPVLHDVDGDGQLDVVVGDLIGKVTVAQRIAGEGPPAWAAEAPMQNREGKDLKFHNW